MCQESIPYKTYVYFLLCAGITEAKINKKVKFTHKKWEFYNLSWIRIVNNVVPYVRKPGNEGQ